MKVLIVSNGIPEPDAPLNGIFAWDQARALHSQGVEVIFVALDFRRKLGRKWGKDYFTRNEIPVFRYSLPTGMYRRCLPWLEHLWFSVLDDAIHQCGRPDVVHAHFYFMGAIVASTYAKRNIPLVVTEHSSKLNKPLEEISTLDQRLALKAYANAAAVLAVSTTLAEKLEDQFSTPSRVVPNVVDISAFEYAPNEEHVPFQFVSVGRLIPAKGMATLIQAFAQAQFNPEKVQLTILGGGPQKAELQEKIQYYGLQEQVHLMGEVSREQLSEQFQKSDAFVLLSERETFGLSYVEAMAMGLPVIASPCGGPIDFMNEERGILLEDTQLTTITQALYQLIQTYESYDKNAIATSIRQDYSASALAHELLEIYEHVCQEF